MSSLRIVFVVQGEGRGHMTQALALAGFLRSAGHEVTRVLVGRSPHRSIPDYFLREMEAPVESFPAPTQVADDAGRAVSVTATVADAVWRMPAFIASGFRIHERTRGADVVVNFLDLVGGLSRVVLRSRVPAIAVAHNYVFLHPAVRRAPGRPRSGGLVMAYARGTASRAATRVALSFGPLQPSRVEGLLVAPPLLRPGLDEVEPSDGGYLLAYALNPGYARVLASWQGRNPGVAVRCYVDGGSSALDGEPGAGFEPRALDDVGFMTDLAGCRAYVGSAGFESICEAFYLGKPVLAVPTEGQVEQTLNAWDAERAGAARAGSYADLDGFWAAPSPPSSVSVDEFRDWVAKAPDVLVDTVERVAGSARSGTRA